MKKFIDILEGVEFEEVWKYVMLYYPDMKNTYNKYYKVFDLNFCFIEIY